MIILVHVPQKVKEMETFGHNKKYILKSSEIQKIDIENIPSMQEELLWSDLARNKKQVNIYQK